MVSKRQNMAQLRFLFFGFRRGGSSIAFSVIQHLFINSGLQAADIAAEFYRNGTDVPEIPAAEIANALTSNHLVGCFRSVPDLSQVDWALVRPILMVRDPRDCQLSWFHARFLHVNDAVPVRPVDGAFPHETLVEGEDFAGDMRELFRVVKERDGLILRYEDLVADPIGVLDRLIGFTRLPFSRSAYDTAVVDANFLQGLPNVRDHNRSGMPNEALHDLDPGALRLLNDRFGELVADLGYHLDPSDKISRESVSRMKERDAIKRYLLLLATENALRRREVEILENEIRELTGLISREKAWTAGAGDVPGSDQESARGQNDRMDAMQSDIDTLKEEMGVITRQNDTIIDICEQLSHSVVKFGNNFDKMQSRLVSLATDVME